MSLSDAWCFLGLSSGLGKPDLPVYHNDPNPSLPKSSSHTLWGSVFGPLKAFSGGVWRSRHLLTRYLEDEGNRRKVTLETTIFSFPAVSFPETKSLHMKTDGWKTSFLWGRYMGGSKNRGTPKSSILIGFSIINHPFWGTPIFGNTNIFQGIL